jgi:hypothetical protein
VLPIREQDIQRAVFDHLRWRGMRGVFAADEIARALQHAGPKGMTRTAIRDLFDELLSFEHGGISYTAGVGRFENSDLAEIFLNTSKNGTAVDVNARDAAVAVSLLLQHGCHVDTLRKALTRNSDGSASGPLARALDLLAEP